MKGGGAVGVLRSTASLLSQVTGGGGVVVVLWVRWWCCRGLLSPKTGDPATYGDDGDMAQAENDPLAWIEQLDQLLVRASTGQAQAFNRRETRPTRDLAIGALQGMCKGVSAAH